MADNNRRNRPSSGYGSNDNFNWEEYDMKTSSASGAPRRRRQAASTKPTRSPPGKFFIIQRSTVKAPNSNNFPQ